MKPQTVFDKTVNFLLKQGRPAMRDDGDDWTCLYRGPNGTKCAVGFWMPDDCWHESMNGTDLGSLIREEEFDKIPKTRRKKLSKWIDDFVIPHRELLTSLQAAHDSPTVRKDDESFHKTRLKARLREVAKRYGLGWKFR
jgi:hypothetical protein